MAARRYWLAERDAEQHAARVRSAHRVAMANSPRESQRQETWRQLENGLHPAVPDQGVGR